MRLLTSETFAEALQEQPDLIVKFTADWCPDCRRIEAAYAEFPVKFEGLQFAEVDTVASKDLAERFDVRGIPSLLVFRGGELADRLYSRDAKTVKQVEEFVARQLEVSR